MLVPALGLARQARLDHAAAAFIMGARWVASLAARARNAEDTEGEFAALLKDLLPRSLAVLLRGVAGNSGYRRRGGPPVVTKISKTQVNGHSFG